MQSFNSHKIEEIRKILAKEIDNFDVDSLISYKELGIDDPVEDGKTFLKRMPIKAKYVSEKTSSYAIADDSGLCVEIMGNAPGIFLPDGVVNTVMIKQILTYWFKTNEWI